MRVRCRSPVAARTARHKEIEQEPIPNHSRAAISTIR